MEHPLGKGVALGAANTPTALGRIIPARRFAVVARLLDRVNREIDERFKLVFFGNATVKIVGFNRSRSSEERRLEDSTLCFWLTESTWLEANRFVRCFSRSKKVVIVTSNRYSTIGGVVSSSKRNNSRITTEGGDNFVERLGRRAETSDSVEDIRERSPVLISQLKVALILHGLRVHSHKRTVLNVINFGDEVVIDDAVSSLRSGGSFEESKSGDVTRRNTHGVLGKVKGDGYLRKHHHGDDGRLDGTSQSS